MVSVLVKQSVAVERGTDMELSRRNFVKAAGAAIATTGIASAALASESADKGASTALDSMVPLNDTIDVSTATPDPTIVDWTKYVEDPGKPSSKESHEIVVIGAGGCGTAAAIQAKQHGLDVVVLEKKAMAGGSFAGSEGMFAINSHFQKDAGIEIDQNEIIQRLMNYHHWVPNPEMYHTFFEKTASTIDWLEDLGCKFREVRSLGDSDPTWHLYEGEDTEGLGAVFIASLEAAAEKASVDFRFETEAKKLVKDSDGKVTGVLAVTKDGECVEFDAKAVIIGTGGYANNGNFLRQLCGVDPEKCVASGMNGRDGQGIAMARDAGAVMAPDPQGVAWYGSILYGTTFGTPVHAATSLQPVLWVNEKAKRFVPEDMYYRNFPYFGMAHKSQKRVFSLLTQEYIDQFAEQGVMLQVGMYVQPGYPLETLKQDIQDLIDAGNEHIFIADTVAEVAEKAGLDPEQLQATIDTYNGYCDAGVDTEFGKDPQWLNKIGDGPYYLFECQNGMFCTVGGIKVSPKCEALDENDEVIPGLYCGGMDAGGFYGDSYDAGIAAGSCASWAINSGRICEESAKEFIGK